MSCDERCFNVMPDSIKGLTSILKNVKNQRIIYTCPTGHRARVIGMFYTSEMNTGAICEMLADGVVVGRAEYSSQHTARYFNIHLAAGKTLLVQCTTLANTAVSATIEEFVIVDG